MPDRNEAARIRHRQTHELLRISTGWKRVAGQLKQNGKQHHRGLGGAPALTSPFWTGRRQASRPPGYATFLPVASDADVSRSLSARFPREARRSREQRLWDLHLCCGAAALCRTSDRRRPARIGPTGPMDERSDDAPYQGTGRKQPPRGASGKQARPKSISGNMSYQEFIEQPKPRKAQEPIKRTRSHNNVTIEMLGPFVQNNPGSPAPTDGSEANQALLDPHGSDHGHHHPPLGSRHRRSSAANSIGSFSVSSINTFIENEHAAIKEGAFQHGQHPPLPQQPTGYNAPFGGGMSDGIFHSPVAASSVSSASQPTPTMLYGRPPNPDVSPPFFRGGDALTGPPNQSSPDFSAVTGGARRNVTSVSPPRPPASSEAQDPASRYLSSQAELLNYLQHLKDENRALKLELQESNRRNQELLAQLQNAGGFGMKSSTPTPQNTGAYAQQSHQFGSQPHFGHDVAMDRPPNAQPAPTSGMLIRYEENGEWTPLGMVDLGSFMPVPGGMAPPAAVPMQSPLPQGQMMAASWGKDPDHFRAGTPVQRQSPAVQDGAVPYRPNMTPPSHARDWGQGAGQAPPQDGQIATLFGPRTNLPAVYLNQQQPSSPQAQPHFYPAQAFRPPNPQQPWQ